MYPPRPSIAQACLPHELQFVLQGRTSKGQAQRDLQSAALDGIATFQKVMEQFGIDLAGEQQRNGLPAVLADLESTREVALVCKSDDLCFDLRTRLL